MWAAKEECALDFRQLEERTIQIGILDLFYFLGRRGTKHINKHWLISTRPVDSLEKGHRIYVRPVIERPEDGLFKFPA